MALLKAIPRWYDPLEQWDKPSPPRRELTDEEREARYREQREAMKRHGAVIKHCNISML